MKALVWHHTLNLVNLGILNKKCIYQLTAYLYEPKLPYSAKIKKKIDSA